MIYELNESSNNQHLSHVQIGDVIRITLSEIPSAGYMWHVDAESSNLKIVSLDRDEFIPISEGYTGSRIFEFQIFDNGQFSIQLRNFRPWEGIKDDSLLFRMGGLCTA
jgi:predicted secreted protein